MDDFFCANSFFQSGRRVILAHNVVSFHVDMVAMSAQTMIHCHIQAVRSKKNFIVLLCMHLMMESKERS